MAYSSNGITFTAPIADLGAGLEVVVATLDIATDQSFTFNNLYDSGGVLTGGGGDLTVTGSMNWDGGTISGFGTLTIASGASLSLWDVTLDGVTLDNAGAATLRAPGIRAWPWRTGLRSSMSPGRASRS